MEVDVPTIVRELFTAPVFAEDEEKSRIAGLLQPILITVMVLVMLFSVPAYVMSPLLGRVLIEIALAFVILFMLLLLRRGHVRPVAYVLSSTLWILVTYGAYEAGGFRGTIMAAYIGIIVIAELLLGTRAGVIFGTLSIAATGWMLYSDGRGWLPPPPSYATLTTFWIEFTAVVIGVVILLSFVITSLQQALDRASRGQNELAHKVDEVQVLAQKTIEANEFKSRLIARISHEVRTPLGALLGITELLQQNAYGPLTPAQYDITERIISNSRSLERVFAELLDQAQIESGHLRLRKEPFSPRVMAETVYANCLPLAQRKRLTMLFEIDPDLPRILIGDSARVEQILSNLVVNAIKFTETGKVMVCVRRQSDSQWTLQVSDTGIGIPKESQLYIFEPFRQAGEESGWEVSGVGLGLSIVKQLVLAMDGTIHLESDVGCGSTFTVLMPLEVAV
jgi:signal transduction histidine kinase